MDKATENNENILLLGDFNINLFKHLPAWNAITSLFGLDELVEETTRVTKSSATHIDHIYTNNRFRVSDVRIVESGISDHCTIFCHWSTQLPKPNPRGHTTVTFRYFKHFNKTILLFDLSQQPFRNMYNHYDPEEALAVWYGTFKTVIDRHTPVQQKRIKITKPCPQSTQELILEMKKVTNLSVTVNLMNIRNKQKLCIEKVEKAKWKCFIQLVKW